MKPQVIKTSIIINTCLIGLLATDFAQAHWDSSNPNHSHPGQHTLVVKPADPAFFDVFGNRNSHYDTFQDRNFVVGPDGGIGQIGNLNRSPFVGSAEPGSVGCPSGDFVLQGLAVRYGNYVHRIQVRCKHYNKDGILNRNFVSRENGGSNPGPRRIVRNCRPNEVITGITARGGIYLDKIESIRCSRLRPDGTISGANSDIKCWGKWWASPKLYLRQV